jgi:hypothetical protein
MARSETDTSGTQRRSGRGRFGRRKPRESRTYRLTVLFPEGGAVMDDAYQQASTSLDFDWYARRAR